jgi:Tfp pilus assembly protein PilV
MKASLGFALLDALLGVALLAAGVIGLLYVFQGSASSSLLADQTVIATNLARETMETIIAQRDCNLSGCGYAATLTSINTTQTYNQSPVTGFTRYTASATALEVDPDSDGGTDDFLDASPGSGYARVTVTVSWNSAANSIQLVTLLGNH